MYTHKFRSDVVHGDNLIVTECPFCNVLLAGPYANEIDADIMACRGTQGEEKRGLLKAWVEPPHPAIKPEVEAFSGLD